MRYPSFSSSFSLFWRAFLFEGLVIFIFPNFSWEKRRKVCVVSSFKIFIFFQFFHGIFKQIDFFYLFYSFWRFSRLQKPKSISPFPSNFRGPTFLFPRYCDSLFLSASSYFDALFPHMTKYNFRRSFSLERACFIPILISKFKKCLF